MVSVHIAPHEKKTIILDTCSEQRIIVGEYAEVTLIEHITWLEHQDVTLELFVHSHARVTFIQECGIERSAAITRKQQVYIAEHAQVSWYAFLKNIVQGTLSTDIILQGTQAHAYINWLVMAEHTDSVTCVTRQHHCAQATHSALKIKTLAYDSASFKYQGTIEVEQQAKQTYATQYNKNLSMSPAAQIRSEPCLEVHTDNVQCKHGTAISYIDEEQLFYMQSKGLEQKRAEKILQQAFCEEIMCLLPDQHTKDRWHTYLKRSGHEQEQI